MKSIKKWVVAMTLMAMAAASTTNLDAQEYIADTGGSGYQESISMPSLTPYIALSTVAVIGIIVIAVRHTHGGHAH